ncbi:MAG TPA: methyltransferase domain-containing protein [Mesorhizobium sp.]|jgi:SAM-dependent methyltransferase|nr:methyltransferase domain-containing protein [Mesorhizobium sp.]
MTPLFDTELALRRKRRALAQAAPGADFLLNRTADDLADRLSVVSRRFPLAATLFCVTDHAERALLATGKVDEVVRVEADPRFLVGGRGVAGPPETLPFAPESLDLAVSMLVLQEANDLPGLLVQVRRALKPDGLFLGVLAGDGTLRELRESLLQAEAEQGRASPRVHPFTDIRDAGGLLQRAGLALPVADLDTVVVRYDSMWGLMADLRAMGATNTLLERARTPAGRKLFFRAAEIYAERFSDADGRVRASFALLWMSAWAPAPTQQQPLKPGSATTRLADALKPKA